jgi:hypothetical protein
MSVKGVTKVTAAAKWLFDHTGHQGDDCLIWPFTERADGYGAVRHEGRTYLAHRLMCELAHGEPPSPRHQAAHECGKGNKGCVNPRHLSWKTQHENQQDRWKHGTQNIGQRGKLTYAERMEIRELRGKVTQAELAKRFGVDRTTIRCIQLKEPKKHRGVTKWGKRFAAQMIIGGKRTVLGVFDTRDAAAEAYQTKFAEIRLR